MELNAVTQTPSQTAPTGPVANGQPRPAISSDFETFIRMLTTQMRNQDPLNPIESADFAVQLATFSTVEQQVRTNDLLTSLGEQLGAQNLAQFAGWVGMEARARMPVVFDGAPVALTIRPSEFADSARLVVRDETGEVVQRLDITTDTGEVQWAGVAPGGAPLAPGLYQIEVESLSLGDVIATEPAEVHGRISEIASANGQVVLIMENGQQVAAGDILALRKPG